MRVIAAKKVILKFTDSPRNHEEPVSNGRLMTMSNMIEISLDDVTALEPGQIMVDSIRQWRADCQVGQFKIGSSVMKGQTLDMEIVGATISEGEFFGYPSQKWLAILFIDLDSVLSSILLKTTSLDQFEALRIEAKLKGESLLGKTIRAQMSKRVSRANGNGYYVVEFSVTAPGKYAEAITQFRQLHYSPKLFRQLSGPKPAETANNTH